MDATMDGYGVGWPTGADKILLVSTGTGSGDPAVNPASIAAENALKSLVSLMNDCASLVETMLQRMSTSPIARSIDRELGDLRHDLVAQTPLLTYLRYNIELSYDQIYFERLLIGKFWVSPGHREQGAKASHSKVLLRA